MKAVLVNGSPRKNGNTFIMLTVVKNELEAKGIKTELIQAGSRDIHGCTACGACRKSKMPRCAYDDDIVNKAIEAIKDADALILGSPVYFGGITAQMKAFIDRVGYSTRPHKMLKGKVCAGIVVARRNGALESFNQINNLFTACECIVVGSSYWNQGVGRDIGEVANDEEGIETMKTLARNIADVLSSLKK